MSERWYFCLTHRTVEPDLAGPSHDRLGPYASEEEAAAWRERHEGRAGTWEAEDEARKDAWDREDEEWERR
jgi:hypothetical protein